MNKKFKPTQTEELKELVKDFNINLYDIDTSLIINMSDLFYGSIRENYEGIETWDTSNVKNMIGMFEIINISIMILVNGMFLRLKICRECFAGLKNLISL